MKTTATETAAISKNYYGFISFFFIVIGFVGLVLYANYTSDKIDAQMKDLQRKSDEVSNKISELNLRKTELDSIRNSVQQFPALASKIDSIAVGTQKKIFALDNAESKGFKVTPINTRDSVVALAHEAKGFEYLLSKDVNNAIPQFIQSENAYNGFHQVYEIAKYLKKNKASLATGDPESWKNCYKKLSSDYSWKMTGKTKKQFVAAAQK